MVVVMAAVLLWGCGLSTPSRSPSASGEPGMPPPTVVPVTSPRSVPAAATQAAGQTESDTEGVGELDTLLDVTVVSVTDRLRVRSAPGISDDSIKYDPLLPIGTWLYAFNGPVDANGYSWYEVASLALELRSPGPCGAAPGPCKGIYSGWAARASRNGEPWLAPGEADCPPVPTNVGEVLSLTIGARLACFSRVPITIEARLIECNCDVDGGGFQPAWFGVDDQPLLLVDASETKPPADYKDWLIVALDPLGRYPGVLPIGQIVEVTGMFDHPDAQGCLYQGVPIDTAGPPTRSSACRFMFATTSIAASGP